MLSAFYPDASQVRQAPLIDFSKKRQGQMNDLGSRNAPPANALRR